MTNSKTWALEANAVRARILRGVDDADNDPPLTLNSKATSTHLRDILSDKAGRSFSSGSGGRRAAMEPGSDPIRRDMQDFASEILEVLTRHHRAGDFEKLVIIAAPKMLGILRQEMPATLREALLVERPLNLTQEAEEDLRDAVRQIVKEERLK